MPSNEFVILAAAFLLNGVIVLTWLCWLSQRVNKMPSQLDDKLAKGMLHLQQELERELTSQHNIAHVITQPSKAQTRQRQVQDMKRVRPLKKKKDPTIN